MLAVGVPYMLSWCTTLAVGATLAMTHVDRAIKLVMDLKPARMWHSRSLHVRGIGGVLQSEDKLRSFFGRFGSMLSAKIRVREDEAGANTSWAMVTLNSPDAAARALAARPLMVTVPATAFAPAEERELTVNLFETETAQKSTGGMTTLGIRDVEAKQLELIEAGMLELAQTVMPLLEEGWGAGIIGLWAASWRESVTLGLKLSKSSRANLCLPACLLFRSDGVCAFLCIPLCRKQYVAGLIQDGECDLHGRTDVARAARGACRDQV
jgi:hypothetical protein